MNIPPKIEEDLSFDRILTEKLSTFTKFMQTTVPGFDGPNVVDPVYSVLSELSMTELMIRARINEAALSLLLRYSDDLDFLLFGLRRVGESLEAFRERIRLNLNMASPAGSLELYRSLALASANEDALTTDEFKATDARAEVKGEKIVIHLQPNQKLKPDMSQVISKVSAYIDREEIKPAFDVVEIKEAVGKTVNINARAKLSKGQGAAFLEELKRKLTQEILSRSKLGVGLPLSWLYSVLHITGVESVSIITPVQDVPIDANEYLSLGAVLLTEVPA